MLPWVERPTIVIDLGRSARDRAAQIPDDAVGHSRNLLDAIRKEVPDRAIHLAHLVRLRLLGRFMPEVRAASRRIGADWRYVMIANVSYDLLLSQLGCSTVALATPAGPILARNMDWWPEDLLARASYLIRGERSGKLRVAIAGWPGASGVVTGISANGFALALNAVLAPGGTDYAGYPVLLFLRQVLDQAPSFAAARRWLCQKRLATGALVTLVGRDNSERVVIERTPTRHACREPEGNEPLITTNDYRKMNATPKATMPLIDSACSRYDRLLDLLAMVKPMRPVSDEELLYGLTDPGVMQNITAQHVIMRPREDSARLFVPRRFLDGD
jgi:hypothetical protein